MIDKMNTIACVLGWLVIAYALCVAISCVVLCVEDRRRHGR